MSAEILPPFAWWYFWWHFGKMGNGFQLAEGGR
jgi:hypothetical protein